MIQRKLGILSPCYVVSNEPIQNGSDRDQVESQVIAPDRVNPIQITGIEQIHPFRLISSERELL